VSQLQVPRLTNLIRKLFVLRGAPPATELLDEVTPVVVVEDARPEHEFLRGSRLGLGSVIQTGTAVLRSALQLFNPVGSSHLVVVTRLTASMSDGSALNVAIHDTPLVNPSSAAGIRDTRLRQGILLNQGMTAQINGELLVASLAGQSLALANRQGSVSGLAFYDEDLNLVLAPGTGVTVLQAAAAVQTLSVAWSWVERAVERGELP